ncbi:unnamed protein product [Kuraishia capsulata CBS 1993]|uniref:DNA replication factor Cdt1 C-terminal domain-containing protein n=1 Tax=Kuraishia capsulata CBS 1993 TaxID=1382522 RepID=W6MVZ8_9ASCO|nr:uncharacterized protein KUCA_T00002674001 [Kuraishia capsulata CBS 1993]CDK26700.1 unnamed protein product [Kuraishia capsulata CBS 1993]
MSIELNNESENTAQFLISVFKALETLVRLHLQDHRSQPPLHDLLNKVTLAIQSKVELVHVYQICTVYPESFIVSQTGDRDLVLELGAEKTGVTQRIATFERKVREYMASNPGQDIQLKKRVVKKEASPKKIAASKVLKGSSDKNSFKEKRATSGKSLLERIRAKEESSKKQGLDPASLKIQHRKLYISGKLEAVYGILYDLSPKRISDTELAVTSHSLGSLITTVQNSFASPMAAVDIEASIHELAKVLNDPSKVKVVKSGDVSIVRLGALERTKDLELLTSN